MEKRINVFDTIKKIERGELHHDKQDAKNLIARAQDLDHFLEIEKYDEALDTVIDMHNELNSIEQEIRSGEAEAESEEV